MATYAYYPGCSLEHTAAPYDQSIREVFKELQIGLEEIEDWNCCGATMYMSINKTVGYAVSARNLAIAKQMGKPVCAPCSSCYTILRKTNKHITHDAEEKGRINEALGAANLTYDGSVDVRHPLDILVREIGLTDIKAKVKRPLAGLKVAPYYGCQIVRPDGVFDDVDEPMSMDLLFKALGAEVVPYPPKVRCCGGMLMTTSEEIAQKLCMHLLEAAVANGADIIATACPLCEMNLEGYQGKINSRFDKKYDIPIVYFSHLLGIALGIAPERMGLDKFIVPPHKLNNMAVQGVTA